MATDSYEINVKNVGGSSQASQINTSGIQRSIDQVATDLKKLDTSNFQKSLRDLTQGIQKSAIAATNFVSNMQKIEAQLSSSIKAGLTPGMGKSDVINQVPSSNKSPLKNTEGILDTKMSEKFINSIGSLTDAIDKLSSGIKDGLKVKDKSQDKPEEKKENIVSDVKKLLAAVGIGSIAKQIAENEIITPAKISGMLINSNVPANPQQIGSELISSYQNRVANNSGTILGGIGAGAGAAIGSIFPGLGTVAGTVIGYQAGNLVGNTIGQAYTAPESALQQRALQIDYYSNLSRNLPQYRQFAERQYGNAGFMSSEANSDPYLESKAAFGQGFSRFAGNNIDAETTSNILKSLTAQGASSPQEINLTANLLGQIARFTGKSSVDIEKVYKSVEKSGMSPNEGLSKALSLLQSGLSVKETTDLIRNSSQRTEAYNAGQQNYLSATPFQQFSAQLAGNITGVNTEKFFQGDAREVAKARKIFKGAEVARRKGIKGFNQDTIFAQILEMQQGILPGMADNNLAVAHSSGDAGFIAPGKVQSKIIQQTQEEINKATKGRGSNEIINDALSSIGKSKSMFDSLIGSTQTLIQSFEDAAKVFFNPFLMRNMDPSSPLNMFGATPKKVFTQTPGSK